LERLNRYVLMANKVHADDTPVPVLCPGRGTTRQGRLGRMFAMIGQPAVWHRLRYGLRTHRIAKVNIRHRHLRSFRGILQADGYAGSISSTTMLIPIIRYGSACWRSAP